MLCLKYPSLEIEDGIVFFLPEQKRKIKVDEQSRAQLRQILLLCDGYHDEQSIAEQTGIDSEIVSSTLAELQKSDILCDASEKFLAGHAFTRYPSSFDKVLSKEELSEYTRRLPEMSTREDLRGEIFRFREEQAGELFNVITARKSCRQFEDMEIPFKDILTLCHYGYSRSIRAVPSGGALYPLKLFVICPKNIASKYGGYFEYDPLEDALVKIRTEPDVEALRFAFNMDEVGLGSWCQIIICADLLRHPGKYSNRGYRLTLIECGNVAENISLCCEQMGLGSCEFGGLLEDALKQELLISDKYLDPILGIGIGYPKRDETGDVIGVEHENIPSFEKLVGSDKDIEYAGAQTFPGGTNFFGFAKTADGTETGAVAVDVHSAKNKAIVEAFERYVSMHPKSDIVCAAKDLAAEWIDIRKCGFKLTKHFDENIGLGWNSCSGLYDGKKMYIPSDLIYYGRGDAFCWNNSSGIAAHTSYDKAVHAAVGEIIERDALMKLWKTHIGYRIPYKELTVHAQKRMWYWKSQNKTLEFVWLPSACGVTILSLIYADSYPSFVCGASMSFDEKGIGDAINKALMECEYSEFVRLEFPKPVPQAQDIRHPDDHGNYYCGYDNAQKISWIWHLPFSNIDLTNGQLSDIYIYTLCEEPLYVVKAFSDKLIPITFGGLDVGEEPHFFA